MRKILTVILLLGLSASFVQAQIVIGGNVYGGARQADVKKHTFVNIGADHHDVLIKAVYGGNDISGTIGSEIEETDDVPTELDEAAINGITDATGDNAGKNYKEYNTFVRVSPEATKTTGEGENAVTTQLYNIFIGSLFGGGNGDYTYGENEHKPDISKAYLEIRGGTVAFVYGGGNNATVTEATDICIDNSSEVTTSITDGGENSPNLLLSEGRLKAMGLSALGEDIVLRDTYHFSRVFGGNNQAEMSIRPKWHLYKGNIDNLYSGGNAGPMTSPVGLLLEIPEESNIMVNNVYGGCRKADVHPLLSGSLTDATLDEPELKDIQLPASEGYHFPPGLSARVLVRGGDINNVYGGNDITGNVRGGNAVGIYTSVHGDVYGGGNGSYPYTDNSNLKGDLIYGDFYYGDFMTDNNYTSSVAALNDFRPNAEMVSLRVAGKDADHPTIIRGAVYVGGNSATLTGSSAPTSSSENFGLVTRPELKLGSHVIISEVFLGNNGANMVKPELLELMNSEVDGKKFSQIKLKDTSTESPDNEFRQYMDGCGMTLEPNVTFDDEHRTPSPDPATYIPYTAQIGSFYCGGNVGSVLNEGKITIPFDNQVIIYEKLVGGCNKAYVAKSDYNAEFFGGLIGSPEVNNDGNKDKLEINLSGLKIQPKRWKDVEKTELIWNTVNTDGDPVPPVMENSAFTPDDLHRRFDGGNIYGGCFESGHVNGNVIININSSLVDRTGVNNIFDEVETDDETGEAVLYGHESFVITKRNSGVILDQQGMDVLGKALNVFGGGYGEDSEIWGSTTINLNAGYTFQIFGGGEKGAIGKGVRNSTTGKLEYSSYYGQADAKYSTTVNLNNPSVTGAKRSKNDNPLMAEAEFIYGGGFLAPVCGNTTINLDNGRIFNSFAGSCNADIYGHTETYVGVNGFPYVRDHIYGGNDLGGRILGTANFQTHVRDSNPTTENVNETLQKVHGYDATNNPNPDVLNASAYIEYQKGRVANIFGGCYGVYDYTDPYYGEYFYAKGANDTVEEGEGKNIGKARSGSGYTKPFLDNAFVNFRPVDTQGNSVAQIYGAGQGYMGEKEENLMQNRSYVLIDIPQDLATYQGLEVFGAGECGGVGMGVEKATADAAATADKASAIIDLTRGQLKAVYGGSYEEGITRRTVVNVPVGSTVKLENIFGGAYGIKNDVACDVYEANVNWSSENALVGGYRSGIYGGNNNSRRTLYGKVNINAPVYYDKDNEYFATVYGAGYGKDTWSQYTEVNLNANADPTKDGARLYEVYGGGQLGKVMSAKAAAKWAAAEGAANSITIPLTLEEGYTDNGLVNSLAQYKYNTNVRINTGAEVCGYMYNGERSGAYAYGGGLGKDGVEGAGDVYGTTFIGLFGGKVVKDVYAAGTIGSVNNRYKAGADDDTSDTPTPFVATANAYIEGGTCRNVYGGGWQGSVGYHEGELSESYAGDVYGATNVVIGKLNGTTFIDGIPAIERNAYGGGEGGPVYGTATITLNKGYIGYRYFKNLTDLQAEDNKSAYLTEGTGDNIEYYLEKLHDETWKGDGTNRLNDSGCIFGGGYVDNSNVDIANVRMYGGHVRNALFGGGEIAAVGRGSISVGGVDNSERTLEGIYKAGKTDVELYDGHVHRNVFGGGRGYNNVGDGGTLYSDGFVFGKTEVDIYGGEVGTAEGVTKGYGNVFGGGDIGYVYSAYEKDGKLYVGIKDGDRYDNTWEGYYYAYKKGDDAYTPGTKPADSDPNWVTDQGEYVLSEDCKVLVEPHCKVKTAVTIDNKEYAVGRYVPTDALNTLQNKTTDAAKWECLDTKGIIIHNAVFAGGNTSSGSAKVYANATTVFGNATASIHDVYHRDLITVGTGHTGGLYGDGNLTFVDGYRGLNITNYGTDYYTISDNREITIEQYHDLDAREAAYYELRYICIKDCRDKEGTDYTKGDGDKTKPSVMNADDLLALFTDDNGNPVIYNGDPMTTLDSEGQRIPNPLYWKENGVCTIYAGRPMNTIQRADFCGVFGSRMVMQGAQDRVPEIVDHTNYTINRVREVSLNQQHSVITSDKATRAVPGEGASDKDKDDYILNEGFVDINKAIHGNYFGIYNIVNFLGGLTSDENFTDVRVTENTSNTTYKQPFTLGETTYNYGAGMSTDDVEDNASYLKWKQAHKNDNKRNNGRSHNKVALASGVYLELTTEKSTGKELNEKDWGYITGIVELDLINVQQGIGGGFVYAKNEHRTWTYNKKHHTTLTALNKDAVTRKDFDYQDNTEVEWETSGNFVHSTQTIIDDCYNISGKYKGADAVPAHYWYIKGQIYVYDQYISAYTGAPNAYSETVDIPLTITAASQGAMKLLDIKPNKYAYWKNYRNHEKLNDGKLLINDATYYQNDPISYWEWQQLSPASQELFVDETYVTTAKCTLTTQGETPTVTTYESGYVMLPDDYTALRNSAEIKNIDGKDVPAVYHEARQEDVPFDFVFRPSNNISHETGYILTYKVNNPELWDSWYTKIESSTHEKNQTSKNDASYYNGPTYHLINKNNGLFGQRQYEVSNVISEDIYNTYQAIANDNTKKTAIDAVVEAGRTQAHFEAAYLMTKAAEISDGNEGTIHLNPGTAVSATIANAMPDKTSPAFICNSTIQISSTEFIYLNTKMTQEERAAYLSRFAESDPLHDEILAHVVPAYYCTSAGYYGGDYYEKDVNYRGLATWCSMSKEDRAYFEFNYDALDVLVDKDYSGTVGQKYQYDSKAATLAAANANPAGYSIEQSVDYTASYSGNGFSLPTGKTVNVKHKNDPVDAEPVPVSEIANGDELSRTEYEKIANEQRYYAPIKGDAENGNKCYVVVSPLVVGNTPYAVGSTTTKEIYDAHHGEGKGNEVIEVTLPDHTNTYYFCRESYTIGELGGGMSVTRAVEVSGITSAASYSGGQTVPLGYIIAKGTSSTDTGTYMSLTNLQRGFTIHGIAPTETSTFFVSRESDIYDLSAEKIITVIYQYDYEESDGDNVTPVSERHVVNIHLQFKSGIPAVEDIRQPQTVIPGDFLGLREPEVTPGAYEVTGGGWELFENESDAESHINGIDYTPGNDPLYWYQDGYFLAYYAKTYLGKTYSNHLPISVANYHDLKKVMEDKSHHYYVDEPTVKRNSKIYINDATEGLHQLKDFFDLSVLNTKPTEGRLAGHELLDSHVKGGADLEFILHTDINQTDEYWTAIGDDNQCFAGNLHGDGHTISGLTESLFGTLCGNVYNLGVTGTFSSAGVADRGLGYVENCWVSSKSNVSSNVKAVFGSPSGTSGVQVVNCYYPETNRYSTTNHPRGNAKAMPATAFHNGTVAYNLNGFYLYKRYSDEKVTSGSSYSYYTVKSDNSLELHSDGWYGSDPTLSSAGNATAYEYNGYVEDRYGDGDFRYSEGIIPDPGEKRAHATTTKTEYYPIWPDDYLYFGQMLTYGWNDLRPHEETPSCIYKEDGRLAINDKNNRVYRAPAYYQSSTMGVAHFNPSVNLVAYAHGDDEQEHPAYPNMTAIDFCGHNDTDYSKGNENAKGFYLPLLDDDGLTSIVNRDETPNLLVYAPAEDVNSKTYTVLKTYFNDKEPAYAETGNTGYRCVATASTDAIVGHMVTSDKRTLSNHLLVDKKDFDCPIDYQMGDGKRMWYQRLPERYVNTSTGWETVSLPFTAELVTTQQKGEITHFYSGSAWVDEETKTKIGHEYWLREYKGGAVDTNDETVFKTTFNYPDATGEKKDADNTFLWDYYYSKNTQKDANADIYQTYYESGRDLLQYPLLANGTPYIIGFPGTTYREFDLSGNWIPQNTAATTPAKLDRQTITFASAGAASIGVSDDEKTGVTKDNYTFKSNYLSKEMTGYMMNTVGNCFEITSEATATIPFRPYFVATTQNSAPRRSEAKYIVFDSAGSSFAIGDEDPSDELAGELTFSTKPRKLVTTSSLRQPADVRIYGVSGQSIAAFTIQPGETIETDIPIAGVYIIRAANGRYTKKFALK
ncbi:MAG: T9SS type A sorting domain-containing protein [Prevotella sp.]|nr:T9SS type A sorting domain-containing protein [Prevotella sp.]